MQHQFEGLRERLLRAGVAPRHVRRYLRELREHYDDVLQDELTKNADLVAAREAAWARLGTDESLAQSMLGRPELRSTAARFPALFFGVGPVLGWVGAPVAVATLLSLLPEAIRRVKVNAAIIDSYYALCFLHTRLLPVVLGALVLELAARRRLGQAGLSRVPLWSTCSPAASPFILFPGNWGSILRSYRGFWPSPMPLVREI